MTWPGPARERAAGRGPFPSWRGSWTAQSEAVPVQEPWPGQDCVGQENGWAVYGRSSVRAAMTCAGAACGLSALQRLWCRVGTLGCP